MTIKLYRGENKKILFDINGKVDNAGELMLGLILANPSDLMKIFGEEKPDIEIVGESDSELEEMKSTLDQSLGLVYTK